MCRTALATQGLLIILKAQIKTVPCQVLSQYYCTTVAPMTVAVVLQKGSVGSPQHPGWKTDMEFVMNFTRTYVSRQFFTPKYSVNYDFLGQEEIINLPLCYLNILLYTYLYLFYSIFALLDQYLNQKILQNSNEKRI